ncbi:preprotein translocase subunit SecB [Actibacterium mucosum KCTC 23349]|uniref:Protein-export protein SecB n=1 Tax=Actibacterium mucosum KCTC 23349 TaxID=1454373 RepID=A0A037ZQU9_9RHOB|nr:protein-export chaperone SecB [Actibacterium mucosum]KAJ57242.1 preprotein translocase subunit SecB [Actibacterium mucosum KCTC 23349]
MTDETATPQPEAPQAQGQAQAPKMQILGQFVRDLSFENLLMQKGVKGDVSPEIQVQVALDAKKRPTDHQYEVMSKYTVKSVNKSDKAPLFMIELDYTGVFHIENVPEEQLHPFLLIECPRMIFPFVRRIVSDVTRDGGFPPLNLEQVDFVALYRQEIARRAQAQAAEAPSN